MLFGLGAEAEFIDVVDDFAHVVAALDFVFDFAEDLADFVFDGVGAGGYQLEGLEVGEEFEVDEVAEVIAGFGAVVVDLAVVTLRGGPLLPAVGRVKDEGVGLAFEGGFVGFILFEAIEVLEEEQPRGLLRVVELAAAARLFPEHVVDVLEGLLEHGHSPPGALRCSQSIVHPIYDSTGTQVWWPKRDSGSLQRGRRAGR